jgi:hypothetical protein
MYRTRVLHGALGLLVVINMLWGGCAETETFIDSFVVGEGGVVDQQVSLDNFVFPDGLPNPDTACGYFATEAKQVPAAMMIVLDRSSSMTTNNKWVAAQQAIVKAIDSSAFDNMQIGMLAYPAFSISAPKCLLFVLQVSCGVSAIPQIPLQDSGTFKSTDSKGPRNLIYIWLANHGPDTTATDASPGYDALAAAILALQQHKIEGKRLVLFITDGGFSCTSVSNPTRPGYSDGMCPDWEHPDTVIKLLQTAHDHKTAPVDTFIVGVPGSDSTGGKQGPYATAPYHMRLALSAYANAGSPATVPATCDGKTFTQTGGDPSVPCHFDMTTAPFDADALAKVINDIRGRALGCIYKLPEVDDKNQVIDKNKVNVTVSIDGGSSMQLPRRSDPTDDCKKSACWDYDADGNVELLGKACSDVTDAKSAKVEIVVGCMTVLK